MGRTKRLATGVQVLLGLVYLAAGLPKLSGAETAVEQFEKYGFPGWFCRVTGVFETMGGAGLFLGLVRPVATVAAAVVLVPTMVVGALVHRRHPEDHDALAIPPGVLAALLGVVTLRSAWALGRDRGEDAPKTTETDSDGGTPPRIEPAEPPASDAAYRVINPVMERVLRSPLHRVVSDSLALVTFSGRKTGEEYTTPVGYHALGDDADFVLFTHSDWWKNLRGGQPITLRVRGEDRRAIAEPTRDAERVAAYVETFVEQNGIENVRRIGLDAGGDRLPDREALERALAETVVIEVELLDD